MTAFRHPLPASTYFRTSSCLLEPQRLKAILASVSPEKSPAAPVILCVGTDRIIGDCLGPLVGTMVEKGAKG